MWPDTTGVGHPLHGPEAVYRAPDAEVRALFPLVPLLHPQVADSAHAVELSAASLDVRSVIAALQPAAVVPLRIEPTPHNLDQLQVLLGARQAELLAAFPPELGADGAPRRPALSALPLWRTLAGGIISAGEAVIGTTLPPLLRPGLPEHAELAAVCLRPLDSARLQALAPLFAAGSEAAWLARLVAARARWGEPLSAQPVFLSTPLAIAAVAERLASTAGSDSVLPLLVVRRVLVCCPLSAIGDADAQTRAVLAGLEPPKAAAEPLAELIDVELRDALPPSLRARLVPLPARTVLVLLRTFDPEKPLKDADAPLRVESHPVLAHRERRAALYEFLVSRQHDLFADPLACELLAHSRLFPTARGLLRAPLELVYDAGLPDLGLDWSPSEEIPTAVLDLLARHLGAGRPSLGQLRQVLDGLQFLPAERKPAAALGVATLLGRMSRELAAAADELPLGRTAWAVVRLGRLRRPRDLYLASPEIEALVGVAPDLYADARLQGLLGETAALAGFRRPSDVRLGDVVRHLDHRCAHQGPLPSAVYVWLEAGLKEGTLDGPTVQRELESRRWICTEDGTYWNHCKVLGTAALAYFGNRRGYFVRGAAELPLLCRLFRIPTEVTAATIADFLSELATDLLGGTDGQTVLTGLAGLPAADFAALPRMLLACYARLGKSGWVVSRSLPLILCTQLTRRVPASAAHGAEEPEPDEPARTVGLVAASSVALFRSDTPLFERLFAPAGTMRLTMRGPIDDQEDIDRFYELMAIPRLRDVYTVEVDPAAGADVTTHYRQPIHRLAGVLRALAGALPRVAAQRQQLPRAGWVFESRLRALLTDGGRSIRALQPLEVRYTLPGVGRVKAERAAVYSAAAGELLLDAEALDDPLAYMSGLVQGLLPCVYDGPAEEQLADILEILLPLWTAERMHAYLDRRHFPIAGWAQDAVTRIADRIEEIFDYDLHQRLAQRFPQLQSAQLQAWRDPATLAPFRAPRQPAGLQTVAELAPEVVRRLLSVAGIVDPGPELSNILTRLLLPASGDLPPELAADESWPRAVSSRSDRQQRTQRRADADAEAAVQDLRAEILREVEQSEPPAHDPPRLSPITVEPELLTRPRPAFPAPESGESNPAPHHEFPGRRSFPPASPPTAPASPTAPAPPPPASAAPSRSAATAERSPAACPQGVQLQLSPLFRPPVPSLLPSAAPGPWRRLRRLIAGGSRPPEALPEAAVGWGQGGCFRLQGGIPAQLWATPEALRKLQSQPPSAQLRFVPPRLPAPYLYAIQALGVGFAPATQAWKERDGAQEWLAVQRRDLPVTGQSVTLEGMLPPGDNHLPLPLYSRLGGPVQVSGGHYAERCRLGEAANGRLVVRIAGDQPLRVRYQVSLLTVPALEGGPEPPSTPAQWRQPTLKRRQLPEEVQGFLRTQERQSRTAWTRALAVKDFVQWRYRYDAGWLGRPAAQTALSRLVSGEGHHHLELLHGTADGYALGYGSCYELNMLVVELLRQLGIPALPAACWALSDGLIDSPDHLVALAILASPAGPCPLPLDASIGAGGLRRGLPARRPELMSNRQAEALESAPQRVALLAQAITLASQYLGPPAAEPGPGLSPGPASREAALRLRLRLTELLGGDHLIDTLLAVLSGEHAQVETLTAELLTLKQLGLIKTRAQHLY